MRRLHALEQHLRNAARIASSSYVLIGLSAGLGLFVITVVVQLCLGPAAAAAASVGVIAAVPPDQPAPRRRKIMQLLPTLFVGVPLFYGVQRLHDDPLGLGLLIVPASFLAFLGAAWGKRGIPLSVSAMLAVVFSIAVSGRDVGGTAWRTTAYFALGMVAYIVYGTLSNALLNRRYRVQMLVETLLTVAALMRTQARRFVAAETSAEDATKGRANDPIGRLMREQAALADQLQAARDILLESPRTKRRQQLAGMLVRVLELRDHLLACELDVEALAPHAVHTPVLDALRGMLDDLAGEIERLADSLSIGRRPVAFASHRAALASLPWASEPFATTDLAAPSPSPAMLARGIADRVGHIDDETLRLIALARGDAKPDLAVVRATWQMFVSATTWSLKPFRALWRWDAPPLRHAMRAAMAIATGYAISLALPWGTHPYWILLTITVVLRGSFAQTLERRNSRVLGTLLGCLLAGALIALHLEAGLLILIVALAQGVAHAFAIRRYLIAAVAATVLALTQAHALNAAVSPFFEAFERIGDTLIGVAVAWAFSYVLPSWERTQIPQLVRRTLQAHANHARVALGLGQLEAVDNEPELEWRLARREAYDSLSALVQATQRSLSEPRAVRPPLDPLKRLLAHSYQLLAQLTAAKTTLLLRRGRLDPDQLSATLGGAAATIGRSLDEQNVAVQPSAGPDLSDEALTLPDPFEHDLTPWLRRRLQLAVALAVDVRRDADEVLAAR